MRPMHAVAHTNAFKPTLYVHTRSAQLRCCARRPPHVHSEQHQAPLWHDPHEGMTRASVAAVAAVCALAQLIAPIDAVAAQRTKQPPVSQEAGRCDVTALDNFAETRAKFSQEASGEAGVEMVLLGGLPSSLACCWRGLLLLTRSLAAVSDGPGGNMAEVSCICILHRSAGG